MNLEMLKVFCDLADLRSFSKTAEKHVLSQSAISQQLAQLELAYKSQLINRKRRPIELTKTGQLLYQASKDILERYEQFQNELRMSQKTSAGRLNIGSIFSIGMHTLPDYVKKFMVNYPNVNVHIEYFSAEIVYEKVLSGEVDIGIVAVPQRDKRLEVYDFVDELLVLACSPKHPLANEPMIDIHKLQFEKFVAFEKEVPTRVWIDNILQRYNVSIQPVMEFDNIETIKRAVEINLGVSILPQITLLQELGSGTIKAINFSNERFIRPTGIIIRKGKVFGQAGRYLIELLKKKAEE
jgi:DNA-binding transcriptional LysR family regulator